MPDQPAPNQLSVVPDLQTQEDIENILDAPRKLTEAIENLEKQLVDADDELAQSLVKGLTTPLGGVDRIAHYKDIRKAKVEALTKKIKDAEEAREIIEQRKRNLKEKHPEAFKAFLQRKLAQLEKDAAAEGEKLAVLQIQIHALKEESKEKREKSKATTTSKSKKEEAAPEKEKDPTS